MALPVGATLAEIRDRAATKLRLNGAGRLSTQAHANLDEWILEAHAELVLKAPWIVLRQDELVDLVDGQSAYDIPDGWLPGRISNLTILSNVDSRPREYQVEMGVRYYERDAYTNLPENKALPLRWSIVDQTIQLWPPPDTDLYQQMRISGLKNPAPPRADDDLVFLDDIALLQRIVILGWLDLGDAGKAARLETRHEEYLKHRRSQEAIAEPVVLGGRRSRIYNRKRDRIGRRAEIDYQFWFPES